MSIKKDSYRGQWISKKPIKNEDGRPTHEFINVIESTDDYVRAINKNIPKEEFHNKYVRPDEMASSERNPYAPKNKPESTNNKKETNTEKEEVSEPKTLENEETENKSNNGGIVGFDNSDSNDNDNIKFLKNSINFSKNKNEISENTLENVNFELKTDFDINKIIHIAKTMDIEDEDLYNVFVKELSYKENLKPIIKNIVEELIKQNRL